MGVVHEGPRGRELVDQALGAVQHLGGDLQEMAPALLCEQGEQGLDQGTRTVPSIRDSPVRQHLEQCSAALADLAHVLGEDCGQ